MIKIKDNFLIMSDERQESAIEHLIKLSKHPAFRKEKVRIMPDYHEGVGAVIGFTSTYSDLIIPNVVGVDIGCGVIAYNIGRIELNEHDLKELDSYIRSMIPLGLHHRNLGSKTKEFLENHKNLIGEVYPELYELQMDIEDLLDKRIYSEGILTEYKEEFYNSKKYSQINNSLDIKKIYSQLGTLGGGNHFIELDKDDKENIWVVIHSGSRNFGLQIANYFQNYAIWLKNKFYLDIENDVAYLPMDIGGFSYLVYMNYAQKFAKLNRRIMLNIILNYFGVTYYFNKEIESVHNYIDIKHKIIRKGAIELRKDQMVIIPLNMRDGIIIGIGKNNEKLYNWNFSAPHGAGRVMGRNEARKKLKLEDFEKSMDGIFSTSISERTIDEAPMVYKDSNMILNLLDDIIDVKYRLKPIYSLKADN